MNRSSQYHPLKWVVKCRPGSQAFYEPICAFNSDSVAVRYAQECYKTNPHNSYVVWERKGSKYVLVFDTHA